MTERAFDELVCRVMLDAARQEYGDLMAERPEHTFSPDFERRMKKLIHRADHPARWRWMWVGRVAATLAALLVVASVAAAAAGYNLWEVLARWTAGQITLAPGQIDYADPDQLHIPEQPGQYASMQEALWAYGMDRPVVPRRLPAGFELEELIVDDQTFDDSIVFFAAYSRGEDNLVQQVNIYLEQENRAQDSFGQFQKDEGDPVPYEAGGVTHLLTTNAGRPLALWANGPAECSISGDITMEELTAMLASIYETE